MLPPSSFSTEAGRDPMSDSTYTATNPTSGAWSFGRGQGSLSVHDVVREPRPPGLAVVVRRRWRLVAAALLVALALGTAAAFLPTPTYEATAQLFVATDTTRASIAAGQAFQGGLLAEQRASSYASIINSPLVIDAVIKQLGLSTTTTDLQDRVTAKAVPGTVLITVAVQDSSASRAAQIANAITAKFTQQANQIETQGGKNAALVSVMTIWPAQIPLTPSSPNRALSLVLALVAGGAVGLLAAVGRDATDKKVRTAEDVSAVTLVPVVAAVPCDKASDVEPVGRSSAPTAAQVEAFRRLQISVSHLTSGEPSRAIVVTSAASGEGKTSTAVNLAVALAGDGKDVVLVDADLRGGQCARILDLPRGKPGLSEVLKGTSSLTDALLPVGQNLSLTVIGSGSPVSAPGPLLASWLGAVLKELHDKHDFVVIDTTPMLPVADALALTQLGIPYLVVVRAGRTRKDNLAQTVSDLHAAGAAIIGIVINRPRGRSERIHSLDRKTKN